MLSDSVFKKKASEHAIRRMEAFNSFKKFASDDIRSFWVRFRKVMDDVRTIGLAISKEMEYVRALQSLSLQETHRLSVLAAMNSALRPYCPISLREVTVRLFPLLLNRKRCAVIKWTNDFSTEIVAKCLIPI